MPDRAVVDERAKRLYVCPSCANCGVAIVNQPRALVVLSPDRQWLVVLGLDGEFIVQEWDEGDDEYRPNYVSTRGVKDIGQGADDVLADFLAERGS